MEDNIWEFWTSNLIYNCSIMEKNSTLELEKDIDNIIDVFSNINKNIIVQKR